MKKKGRAIIAVILAWCFVLGGCGKSGNITDLSQEEQGTGENSENTDCKDLENTEPEKPCQQPEMEGEITISTLFEQEFLTVAAQQFMSDYPDVKVTINVYKDTAESGTVEDYQTYLNTKIMSGKAEDIFFNSFLPVTKYSEMGVFEDLNEFISMTSEFNNENYFMNVLEAARQEDGKIYLIPYMAKFDCIAFSQELLDEQADIQNKLENQNSARFTESMDIAKMLLSGTDKRNAYLLQMNEISYMEYLIKDNFSQFFDMDNKQVQIDNAEYIRLLETVKELSDNNYLGAGVDFYNSDYQFAAMIDYDVQAGFYGLNAGSGQAYSQPLANENGNVVINANGCLALGSASANKELAWEFVKYLLSDEMQSQPSIHGLTVNRKGFDSAVDRYYEFYTEGNSSAVNKEEYRDLLRSWMEEVGACDMVDSALWTLIDEENGAFFSGKQTAEATAKNLQKKITQYFNE